MKRSRIKPIGLAILASITLLSGLMNLRYMLTPDAHIILFGQSHSDTTYRGFYLVSGTLGIFTALGLFGRKTWAFWLFIAYNIYYIIDNTASFILITEATLLEAGWKQSDNLVQGYRFIMGLAVALSVAYILWIHRYRKILIGHEVPANKSL